MKSSLAPVALLASAALVLTGCTTSSTPKPPHSSSAAPSPSSTKTPVDPQDSASWLVSSTGIGPFQLGANLAAVKSQLPSFADTTGECPNPNATFLTSSTLAVALLHDEHGVITGVGVGSPRGIPTAKPTSPGPRTTSGIGFGATIPQITAAYPGAMPMKAQTDVPAYYVAKDQSGSWISFGYFDGNDTVTSIDVWPGTLPPYEYCG